MTGHHALVLGASGIQGWAIVNQLLNDYPDPTTFSAVTAVTNRPLNLDTVLWPVKTSKKLRIVSGLDLLSAEGQAGVEARMSKINDISTVSHVYFCAYKFIPEGPEECRYNTELLMRAVKAVEKLSPAFKFVVLPTGTKAYGVHIKEEFPFGQTLPLVETHPRIPDDPHGANLFYYHQVDALAAHARGKAWSWCELRPDMIIGFVPNTSQFCAAEAMARYLVTFAHAEGKGAACPWPGTEGAWTSRSNDSSQDTIACAAIWASLHPEAAGGQALNINDELAPRTWSEKWPLLCDYFGLRGTAPSAAANTLPMKDYLVKHAAVWADVVKKHQLNNVGESSLNVMAAVFLAEYLDFDRPEDCSKILSAGFKPPKQMDAKTAWWTAFDRFREAKIIP